MKKYLIILSITAFFLPAQNTLWGMECQTEQEIQDEALLARFFDKYAPPADVCTFIEENKEFFLSEDDKKVPGYPLFLKDSDVTRLINAQRLRSCIKKHNADCFEVAQKYAYNLDESLTILAEYIEPECKFLNFSLKEIQQLTLLSEETGFSDLSLFPRVNIIRNSSNKLVFIDTEDCSFNPHWKIHNIPAYCKAQFTARLLDGLQDYSKKPHKLDTEVLEWLRKRVDVLKNSPEGTQEAKTIVELAELDDPEIDLERIKLIIKRKFTNNKPLCFSFF